MRKLRAFAIRFGGLFRREGQERDLAEELMSHLQFHVEDNVRAGMSAEQARRQALIKLGGLEQTKELYRDRSGLPSVETLLQDLRYAGRTLRRAPGFTIVAVLTLALGVGANTAVFSAINAVLLRHLPFRNPGQLVLVRQPGRNGGGYTFSIGDYEDYRDRQKTFAALSLWVAQSVNLTGGDRPDRIIGSFVSANFFPMMEVRPLLGRTFAAGEDQPGGEPVAVLDYGTWQTRFGGNPGILGSKLTLNGEPYTVIGVLPPSFFFPWGHMDVWMTIQHYPNYSLDRATAAQLIMGRVRDGVSLEQATADLERIAAQLTRTYPREHPGIHIELTRMRDLESAPLRASLLILAAAVAMVLLIACANLGSLLLARGAARAHEIAIRRALGAARMRLIRQLLTEFLVITAVAGAISIVVARGSLALLLKLHPLPPELTPSLDSRVLGFAFLLALGAGVVLGTMPALQLSRTRSGELDLSSERSGAGTARASRLRLAMIVVQTALSIVLLAAAALLVRSVRQLTLLNPGFRSDHVLSFEYRLPKNHYGTAEQQWAFHREMLQRIRQVPGVISAAIVQGLPFSGNGSEAQFSLPGMTEANHLPVAQTNVVTPEYFKTMGIALLRGRDFADSDTAQRPTVAVVSSGMAKRYWPHADPLGQRIHFIEADIAAGAAVGSFDATIIGVVTDAKQFALRDAFEPQVYFDYSQKTGLFGTLVARTAVEPMSLAGPVRDAVWSVDSNQPLWKLRSMDTLLEREVAPDKFLMILLSAFGAIALALTAVGTYGLVSYAVSQRTREIGVRMTLGATPRAVLKLVLQQGLLLVLLGSAAGVAGALVARPLLQDVLYGVRASDPVTLLIAAGTMIVVALVASYVPARRATKVDPMVALRYE